MTARIRRSPMRSRLAERARTTRCRRAGRWRWLSRPAACRYLDAWIATVTAPLAAEPDHRPTVLAARDREHPAVVADARRDAHLPRPDAGRGGAHRGWHRPPRRRARRAGAERRREPRGGHPCAARGRPRVRRRRRAGRARDHGARPRLAAGAWPDGGHRTGTLDEHRRAMRRYLAAVENARRFALHLPAGFLDRVGAVCDFVLHTSAVDGRSRADGRCPRPAAGGRDHRSATICAGPARRVARAARRPSATRRSDTWACTSSAPAGGPEGAVRR